MSTKCITYGKTVTGKKLQNKLETVSFILTSDQPYGDLVFYNAWVYAPGGLTITKKYMVYTPIAGSPTISIMIYAAHYGGSPKLNINTRC